MDDSAQKLRFARTVPTQILLGFCVSGRRRPTLDRRFAVPSTPAPMNPSQNWGKVFISRSPISPLLPLPVQPHEITAQNLRLVGVSLNQWKRVTPEAQP